MTSVNLEKTLECLTIQENLRYGNLTDYYLCKALSLHIFLYPERHYTNTK